MSTKFVTPSENPWKTREKETVFETPWIRVENHRITTPSGKPGEYGKVCFKQHAIGIVPLDEDLNTWVVGQFRYPLNTYSWEIIEGGGEFDESPLEAAKRELLEESGIEANYWEPLMEMEMSNAATDELAFIFLARDLHFHEPEPEEDEILQIVKLPFSELFDLVMAGEIRDSFTIAAVLKVQHLIQAGKIK